MSKEICVIGGGPAGMMAAISAAQAGAKSVTLIESGPKLGRKLLLTGKGRCNFSNTRPLAEFIEAFGAGGRFLHGALARFSQQDLVDFFESRGVPTKTERGQRLFPQSDKGMDILETLEKELNKLGVDVLLNCQVKQISKNKPGFEVELNSRRPLKTDRLIIATGGLSYPETGSTGDGYKWALKLGHKILEPKPDLAPLFVLDPRVRELAGLTLKNITLEIWQDHVKKGKGRGELLFTHQGLSGPVAFQLTTLVYDLTRKKPVWARLNLKPALNRPDLKKSLYRRIHDSGKKEYQSLLKLLLPASMIDLALKETKIDPKKKNGQLTLDEVERLMDFIQKFEFKIEHTAPIERAIVTNGGVDYREINPKSMESKLVPGLYFGGEVIGLNGPTGGFNLQKAFSTGWVAGQAAAKTL